MEEDKEPEEELCLGLFDDSEGRTPKRERSLSEQLEHLEIMIEMIAEPYLMEGLCDLRDRCLLKLYSCFGAERAETRAGSNYNVPESFNSIRLLVESISKLIDAEFLQRYSNGALDEENIPFLQSKELRDYSASRRFALTDSPNWITFAKIAVRREDYKTELRKPFIFINDVDMETMAKKKWKIFDENDFGLGLNFGIF